MALVAIVGWSLVHSANQARDRAEYAAERDARDLWLAMRSALRQPAILLLCPDDRRFEATASGVTIDEDVGWLAPQAASPFGWRLRELMEQAQQAEFVDGAPEHAAQLFDEMLERQAADAPDTHAILARAAWQAHRNGDRPRASELLARLDEQTATWRTSDLRDRNRANSLASAALLAAANSEPLDQARWRLLHALPDDLARPTFERLRELGVDSARHAIEQQRIAGRRELLRQAGPFVRAGGNTVQVHGQQIALWFRQGDGGQGAIVEPGWLTELPGRGSSRPAVDGLPPIPDRGKVVFHKQAGAEPLLPPLAWIAQPPLPEVPWFAQPTAILGAGLGLLLLFAGSVWATMRGLSQETASMRARTEFLSGVTHELKTPVASMRLIADVLHDDSTLR